MRYGQLVEVARRANDGVLTRRLAAAHGVPTSTWHDWLARHDPGRTVAPGVRLLDERPSALAWLRAAVEAMWPHALLTRRSALWAWGLPKTGPRPLEVLIPEGRRALDVGPVRVIRTRTLRQVDWTIHHGWPVVRPARALLDLAVDLEDDPVLAILLDLLFHDLCTVADVQWRLDLTPTAWGHGRLQRVIANLGGDQPDSIFEWWVAQTLRRHGLEPSAGPQRIQTPDGTFEVDLVLPGRIAVECHGATHRDVHQLARDVAKSNALALAEWLPLAVDFPTFREDPDTFVATVARASATRDA